jgi:hypothetical protein
VANVVLGHRSGAPGRDSGRWHLGQIFALGLFAVLLPAAILEGQYRLLITGLVLAGLLCAALVAPRVAVPLVLIWLTALGAVRRLMAMVDPEPAYDPLLLVGPVALVALTAMAARNGAIGGRTPLSNSVLGLSVVLLIAAVNPLQSDVTAGITGLIFVLPPLVAFWVGRGLLDDRPMGRVFGTVALLGVVVAAYGHWQTLVGFPRWDQQWIDEVAAEFLSLNVGETVRPFASFASFAEYSMLLAAGLMVWLCLAARRTVAACLAIPFIGSALLLSSTRGPVVLTVLAGVLALAARWRVRLAKAVLGIFIVLPLMSVGISTATQNGRLAQNDLLRHQLAGLSNPLRESDSTVSVHLKMISEGLKTGISNPFGLGLERVTIAGEKRGLTSLSTEADLSNVTVAAGIPGFLLFALVLGHGLLAAYRLARARQDWLALVALAMLIVTLSQWLNGGHYATSILPWLALGWVDRTES